MIGKLLASGSFARRIATRAVAVAGAVWIGGLLSRSLAHDQVLVFPVGSVFPDATHFGASWRQAGEREARGGVQLAFSTSVPLEIRQHADLPNGDYVVSIEVLAPPKSAPGAAQNAELSTDPRGVQTNIERRVTLAGGETMVALAAGGF